MTKPLVKKSVEAQRAANEETKRAVLLWQLPLMPNRDIPTALNVSPGLGAALKAAADTPPLLELSRRSFVRTSDLRAWIDEKADAGKPGVRRLRRVGGTG